MPFSIGRASELADHVAEGHMGRSSGIWLARLALYAGLFFGIGGAVFPTLCSSGFKGRQVNPSIFRHPVILSILLGSVAAVVSLGLFGLDALDLAFSDWHLPSVWKTAFESSIGLAMLLALIAFGLALVVLRLERKARWGLALLALLGLALAASGHASVAPPQWLSRPAVWLHGVAVAIWIGAFLPLLRRLRHQTADLDELRCFSRIIPAVLGGLIISGIGLALLQLDAVTSLWSTSYGRVLLVKLGLVVVLLGLGAFNRYRLTDGVLHGDAGLRRRMRRVIRLEIVVAVLILAVVALWRFTPPPRSLAQASAPAVISSQLRSSAAMAELEILPASGEQAMALRLRLFDAEMSPLTAQEVRVAFADKAAGVEPIRFFATAENGTWRVADMHLPALPRWTVEIDALISDFDRVRLKGEVEFQPTDRGK